MKFYGGYDITEIDEMNPQERDIFYYLLLETIKEKNKAREKQRAIKGNVPHNPRDDAELRIDEEIHTLFAPIPIGLHGL